MCRLWDQGTVFLGGCQGFIEVCVVVYTVLTGPLSLIASLLETDLLLWDVMRELDMLMLCGRGQFLLLV